MQPAASLLLPQGCWRVWFQLGYLAISMHPTCEERVSVFQPIFPTISPLSAVDEAGSLTRRQYTASLAVDASQSFFN